jgi:hypothetical protein
MEDQLVPEEEVARHIRFMLSLQDITLKRVSLMDSAVPQSYSEKVLPSCILYLT